MLVLADSLVIIPTYNEKENIANIIEAVFSLAVPFHVLVVDDGSPDGTALIIKELQKKYPNSLHLIERKGKLGLGTAYIRGFKFGIEKKYDFICEMDADFSHSPKDLLRLRGACIEQNKDVAIGSRYVKGGKCVNWPMDRLVLSYGASWYVKMITWMMINDPTAGFVCYRRKVLETLDLDKIRFKGYAFQIEMKFASRSLGFQLVEVPITFTDRIEGISKMSKGIIKEAVFGVLAMKWSSFFNSYKRTVKPSISKPRPQPSKTTSL
jgi:dolichol-phosphate mannosyltransferase